MRRSKEVILEFIFWIPVGVIPIFNGIIRMMTYGNRIGDPIASFISSGSDIAMVLAYCLALQTRQAPRSPFGRAILWVALSTLNHFLLGHLVFGVPFPVLLLKYNVMQAQTWGVISAVIFAAPLIAQSIRNKTDDAVKA